ncbi:hypothetical protein ACTMS0_03565 [Micromonospora sp. H33]|uniref:hypothetical protein n=1 Tax=Micromonospora sp. H33 TaxID=3452215 RepID=UPI003F8A4653
MPSVRRLAGKDFNGYLRIRLPHPLDEVVDSVVDTYMTGPQAMREGMLDAVDRHSAGVLSVYGQRMAAMAV